jgi:lysophospholipase L1-like esterase
LAAIAGVLAALNASSGARAANCGATSLGYLPIDQLGTGLYLGQFQGGFYPGGVNSPPLSHLLAGRAAAAAIEPLDTLGSPSPGGHYVLLSIGMSNTTQEYCSTGSALPCDAWTFMGQAALDSSVNHSTLVLVNGARSGQVASTWDSPADANYDLVRDNRLTPLGLTEQQVVAAWVKLANGVPSTSLPAANADARTFEVQLGDVARALKTRYPNIRMAFFSTRLYAGYASTTLNPEPYAYEYGFSVKWLIAAQIAQWDGAGIDPSAGDLDATVAPWVGWGPYLWADGLVPRSDGLTWACADFENDGTHPSTSGEQKVGTRLLAFLSNSSFAVPWFRAGYILIDDFETGDTGSWSATSP